MSFLVTRHTSSTIMWRAIPDDLLAGYAYGLEVWVDEDQSSEEVRAIFGLCK
jgi:hypothetical protein